MDDRRWRRSALLALIAGVALVVLSTLIAPLGAPIELVVALSNLSFLVLALAFVLLVIVAARRSRWSLTLSAIALAAEVAAALLLLVQEPQPAYLHPEWAWYWPVANSLYFGGLALTLVALLSAGIALSASRSRPTIVAMLMAVGAFIVNRLAPYR